MTTSDSPVTVMQSVVSQESTDFLAGILYPDGNPQASYDDGVKEFVRDCGTGHTPFRPDLKDDNYFSPISGRLPRA